MGHDDRSQPLPAASLHIDDLPDTADRFDRHQGDLRPQAEPLLDAIAQLLAGDAFEEPVARALERILTTLLQRHADDDFSPPLSDAIARAWLALRRHDPTRADRFWLDGARLTHPGPVDAVLRGLIAGAAPPSIELAKVVGGLSRRLRSGKTLEELVERYQDWLAPLVAVAIEAGADEDVERVRDYLP